MTDYRDNQGSNEDWERWHDKQKKQKQNSVTRYGQYVSFFQDQFLLNQKQVSITFGRMGILIDCHLINLCFVFCLFSFSSQNRGNKISSSSNSNILDSFLYLSSNKSKNNNTPDLILTFKRIQWINYLNTSHHVAYLVLWPSVPTYEAINLETLQ